MDNILLSIVIPVYNSGVFFNRTLQSISDVISSEIEVVVVNDGTEDNSMDYLENYKDWDNLQIINQSNQGVSQARNNGLALARGKWVWFVDSDDTIASENYKQILSVLESDDADVLSFVHEARDENDIFLMQRGALTNSVSSMSGLEMLQRMEEFMLQGNRPWSFTLYAPISRFIFNRHFLVSNQLSFQKGIYHEDIDFGFRALLLANKASDYPIISYYYLIRNNGSIMSNPANRKKRIHGLSVISDIAWDLYQKEAEGPRRTALFYVNQRILHYLWNPLTRSERKSWSGEFNFAEKEKRLKILIKSGKFYTPSFKSKIIHKLFLFSPRIVKAFNKKV